MNKYANGLGPTSWGYCNALLPFSGRFYFAAIGHDFRYSIGFSEIDKENADEQFFQDCLDASGKNLLAILFSILYFILVSLFGNFFFNYANTYASRASSTRGKLQNTNS